MYCVNYPFMPSISKLLQSVHSRNITCLLKPNIVPVIAERQRENRHKTTTYRQKHILILLLRKLTRLMHKAEEANAVFTLERLHLHIV